MYIFDEQTKQINLEVFHDNKKTDKNLLLIQKKNTFHCLILRSKLIRDSAAATASNKFTFSQWTSTASRFVNLI